MKTFLRTIALSIISLFTISCSDYLDKQNFDIITPEKVWQEPKLINAVLVNLYSSLQTDDFNYWYNQAWRLQNPTSMSDEATGSFQKDPVFDNGNASYTYQDELFGLSFSTVYKSIRNCNNFLEQLQEAQSLNESQKEALVAEVRFLRAFNYFALVKRYGGVPLISKTQAYNADHLDSLQVPRSKEIEVYDFIINEANEAAKQLPATRDDANKYRATSGAALALASRAALYAGSIAKYGDVELDGIIGIPSEEAKRFFQISYKASKELIASGVYSLHNNNADKAANYCEIFTKTTDGNNGEYIFQKQYDVAAGHGHDWDKRNVPFSYRGGGWGCGIAPTLDMVEEYEYIDGTDGKLNLTDKNGSPIRLQNPYDLFANKDPRLFASIYLPGSPCMGGTMEWIRGVIDSNGKRYQATSQPGGSNSVTIDGVIYSTSGKDGGADAGDASKTGFYQKKFIDETLTDINMGKSETPWPLFRLGEIYLNLAEAAFELGQKSEALEAINKIRERAGISKLTNIDMAKIRHERKIELAFEGHRFWDLKRWRISDKDVKEGGLNGYKGSALYPWYNVSDGRFTFEKSNNIPKQTRIFLKKNYYTKISSSDMNSNPKLVQNPGYTN